MEVYREALAFTGWLSKLVEEMPRLGEAKDQLDRAECSIVLNIAEGNGKYQPKDRCRFFDIAHGSALECVGGLDILVARGRTKAEQVLPGKVQLQRIMRMLYGLLKRHSTREYERGENEMA